MPESTNQYDASSVTMVGGDSGGAMAAALRSITTSATPAGAAGHPANNASTGAASAAAARSSTRTPAMDTILVTCAMVPVCRRSPAGAR